MNKITKQCVAAVASLAMAGTLCVAGAVVAGSSAWAADGTACDASKAPWDQTKKNCTGKITINKWKYEGDNVKNTHVKAKFKVTKVTQITKSGTKQNLDLTSKDDWLALAATVPTLNATPNDTTSITLGTPAEKDTTNGVAEFDNLGIGLYKVEEESVEDGYQKLANPFFMTIPEITRDATNKDNTYTYNVEVNPKNAYIKNAVKKTVDTKGMVGVGDEVPYTISASAITTSNTEASKYTKDDFTDFAVWDDVPTKAYAAATTAVTGVSVVTYTTTSGKETASTTKDLKKTDYKVNAPEEGSATNGIGEGYSRLKITFNEGGLTEIANQRKTSTNVKVIVSLKFTLKKDTTLTDVINKYGFQQGHKTGDPTPNPTPDPTPGPESKVTLVKFNIKKVNGTDGKTPLAGAEFAIFANEAEAKACAADPARSDVNCKNKSAKGFENAATGTPDTGLTNTFKVKVTDAQEPFYVVETKAPEKFALSPIVEKVVARNTADAAGVTDGGHYDAQTATFTYSFKDVPTKDDGSWFKLPKTGAAGVIIFALIGLGLVGSGMFVFLKNRKKEEEQAA
ncbi:SpaH/EbpB family LPXTG-anchored major pilin [Gardnerella pickettii]|uniref:SpaH/EbpB family LPXTG-anchored major pilin n=1 Tax=Gardnerella pickettii TaxID=2914924 RepID=UPI000764179C|nr:SpaH/EbpB family LPXTG-anchored major pilin [Gardnerella pickettii]MDF2278321.1 SpaH/EbpB family LPXTG-anchored major pilin [Gardnerella pickettii]